MKIVKRVFSLLIFVAVCFCLISCGSNENNSKNQEVEMILEIGEYSFSVNIEDSETTAALFKMLPLSAMMSELNGNEKYYYLSESLPAKKEKVGSIEAGDVMLYGDDCLVIFYKSFKSNYSYTRIGKIENIENLEKAVGKDDVSVIWKIK